MGLVPTGGGGAIPTQYTCDVSPSYTPQDTETFATAFYVDCVDCPDVENANLWNCNLCGGDERYEQPILDTDEFFFQFTDSHKQFNEVLLFALDPEGNSLDLDGANSLSAFFTTDGIRKYINIKLNSEGIQGRCFKIKVFFLNSFNEATFNECVSGKMEDGSGYRQAALECAAVLFPDAPTWQSDLFRKTDPECEDTILFEADYEDNRDCDGRYHGANGSGQRYILRVRVPGTIETTEMGFEKIKVFENVRRNRMTETYNVRSSTKIPNVVAGQIAIAMAGKRFFINGAEFFDPTPLQKNNDEGKMWILNFNVFRKCFDNDFACD